MRSPRRSLGLLAAFLAAPTLFSLSSAVADQPVRFMSLRTGGVEGRSGPGDQHRVTWLYERAGLPVMVLAQQGEWRQVRDPDGDEVWMLAARLEARRTVYVREQTTLRRSARAGGQAVAHLMPGVVASITRCDGDWRLVAVGGRIGWVKNASLWGGDCAGLATSVRP
jgi:SH3-like domain-containing protein